MQADLLVIGGGINGTGIAADAAGRGLSVVLCEKDDLANHTSSASSKLIHGGLRYLEHYEFKLVHEALHEREILLRNARHLVHPLEFVLPYESHLRPAWMIRLGLLLYDYLTQRKILAHSKKLDFTTDVRGNPLKPHFQTGFSYMDCQTDDARLVIANALQAKKYNAEILTRHKVTAIEATQTGWKIDIFDKKRQQIKTIFTRAVVNATGAWVSKILMDVAQLNSKSEIKWVKGSHFIVPKLYADDHAYILQNKDQRIVFAIPYQQNYTLIGTTDVIYTGDLNQVEISNQEIEYLLALVNMYFRVPVTKKMIVWSYAGVRSLYNPEKTTNPTKITREYHLELITSGTGFPLLSVYGGKLTTYRSLSERVLNKLAKYFPEATGNWTATAILPGGDFAEKNFHLFVLSLQQQYPQLPKKLLQRLAKNYGRMVFDLLRGVKNIRDLGMAFTDTLYEKEVQYLLKEEWAINAEDILWRRTKEGIAITKEALNSLTHYCQQYDHYRA